MEIIHSIRQVLTTQFVSLSITFFIAVDIFTQIKILFVSVRAFNEKILISLLPDGNLPKFQKHHGSYLCSYYLKNIAYHLNKMTFVVWVMLTEIVVCM